MKIAYYRRKGWQNAVADVKYARNAYNRHSAELSTLHRDIYCSRIDTLDCEIYQQEFKTYVDNYRKGWEFEVKNRLIYDRRRFRMECPI